MFNSHPYGSIGNGYLAEEWVTFMSKYLYGVEKSLNWPRRNQEEDGTKVDAGSDIEY